MNEKGFSLLEVLFVIAIMGVIAIVIFINFDSTIVRARDTRRLSEFDSFTRGLEIYYDLYGMYPCGDTIEENNENNNLGGTYDISTRSCSSNRLNSRGFLNGFGIFECDGDLVNYGLLPVECQVNPAGLYNAGILTSNRPTDPAEEDDKAPYFVYAYHVSPDRQEYVLASYLEDLKQNMVNDGGLCPYYYEAGNAVGKIRPWKDIVCGCTGLKKYSICN